MPVKTTLRERVVAGVLTAFVATSAAALMWLIRGIDFSVMGPACAAGGLVLGYCFGARVGYFFLWSVG